MPKIVRLSFDELPALDGFELVAQQIMHHGVIHALQHLLATGVSRENVASMLADQRKASAIVERTAAEKGVLLGWDGPNGGHG